jgi:ketosteroid isomerase-like protein
MRTIQALLILVLNCFVIFSCDSVPVEKTAIASSAESSLDKSWAKAFLDSSNQKFSEQFASGDSVAVASNYWPDAQLLLDNSDPVKGNNIVNAWGGAIRMGMKELSISTTDITGSPTFIIETGNYEMKDASKSVLDKGKYVVVWENRNGEWKIYRDIGSTSMPAPK